MARRCAARVRRALLGRAAERAAPASWQAAITRARLAKQQALAVRGATVPGKPWAPVHPSQTAKMKIRAKTLWTGGRTGAGRCAAKVRRAPRGWAAEQVALALRQATITGVRLAKRQALAVRRETGELWAPVHPSQAAKMKIRAKTLWTGPRIAAGRHRWRIGVVLRSPAGSTSAAAMAAKIKIRAKDLWNRPR